MSSSVEGATTSAAAARTINNFVSEYDPDGISLEEENTCSFPKVRNYIKGCASRVYSVAFLKKRLPILQWLPSYSLYILFRDFVAGVTVGITAIPQGIAYAVVAGLPPQYGLYAGFMGAYFYIILGSCKDVTIGPTAIMALMTQDAIAGKGEDFAVLLAFLSGCIILLLGILNLGFLVDFISLPVTSAFTSAAAVTIGSSQLKGLLGIDGDSNDFLESWTNVIKKIGNVQLWDIVLGVCTIVGLLILKKIGEIDKKRDLSGTGTARKVLSKVFWFLALSRNAIAAIVGTLLAYILYINGDVPFKITGDIQSGLPPFKPPPFTSSTSNGTYYFIDMIGTFGTNIITLPLIGILESVAIAKAFAGGKPIDATQEMIALGACNIVGSFVLGMPVTGSFTRTAVNNSSGVKTTMGGLFTGTLVLLALAFLTSTFYFIPKATLSAIILAAMFSMVDISIIPLLWRTKRLDLIPLFVTFFACLLLGLELGIIVGIVVNLIFILYDAARPKLSIRKILVHNINILLVVPQQNLIYPAAEYVREEVIRTCINSHPSLIILDGSKVKWMDATVAKVLKLLTRDIIASGSQFVLWRWNKQTSHSIVGMDHDLESSFCYSESIEEVVKECSNIARKSGNGNVTITTET